MSVQTFNRPLGRMRLIVGLGVAATVIGASLITALPASAVVAPSTCAAVAALHPHATDGNYKFNVFGKNVTVWCADMTTTPTPYLSLLNTAAGQNTSNWYGTTSFSKLKLIFPTTPTGSFAVEVDDFRFATTAPDGTPASYGSAAGCDEYYTVGNVDLRGTPFAVTQSSFTVAGWAAYGGQQFSSLNQVADLAGGGMCGGTFASSLAMPLVWTPTKLKISSNVAKVVSGGTATFTDYGLAYNQIVGDLTASTIFTSSDPTDVITGASIQFVTLGRHLITATDGPLQTTKTITVIAARANGGK